MKIGINKYSIKCCIKCKPPQRHPGCHDECKVYKEEKERANEQNENIRKQKNQESDYVGYVAEKKRW